MKNRTLWIALTVFISLISCSKKQPTVITQKGTVDSFEVSQLLAPQKLIATKDFLVVVNDNPDTLFQVYRISDLAHFTSFGKTGRSADEFLMFRACREAVDGNKLYVSDVGNKQLKLLGIEQDSSINMISSSAASYELSNGLSYNGDGFLCVNNITPNSNTVEIIDVAKNKILQEISIKESDDDLSGECILAYNGDIVFCAYAYLNQVKFLNTSTGEETKINNTKTAIDNNDPIYYYADADTDGTYFYALYIGSNMSKIESATSEVHIYDMQGALVKVIQLDALLGRFSVGGNSMAYGISPLNPNTILRFQI